MCWQRVGGAKRASRGNLGLRIFVKKVRLRVTQACAYEALKAMVKFLLWCILLVFCWPLALVALVLYPFVWLLLLPFRIVGIAVDGVLDLVKAIILLPARVLRSV